jgi:hypothetical protein
MILNLSINVPEKKNVFELERGLSVWHSKCRFRVVPASNEQGKQITVPNSCPMCAQHAHRHRPCSIAVTYHRPPPQQASESWPKLSPFKRPWRPIGLWHVEAPTFSIQSAHRRRWNCQTYAPAALYPQEDSWYSFLLEAESTLRP